MDFFFNQKTFSSYLFFNQKSSREATKSIKFEEEEEYRFEQYRFRFI
jgi:hypothetical protein